MTTLATSSSKNLIEPGIVTPEKNIDLSSFDDSTIFVLDTIGKGGFINLNKTSNEFPSSAATVASLELGIYIYIYYNITYIL